ncbi:MAG: hypothetical protein IPG26_07210 [Coprothermobacter sp.]|nr:hypothetical protein [Coprothermobacter sp.]
MDDKMDKAVKIRKLYYKVDNKTILEDINFEIHKNEFPTITGIGPNGGGRQILILRLIIGAPKTNPRRCGNIKVFDLKPGQAKGKMGYLHGDVADRVSQ